jgi:predicted TIM-barrel enzyme
LPGEPIIGGGAGTGLSAKCEEAGGIDLIVIYNSGRYRMAGRGSLALLAYGNANEIVMDMAKEVLPVTKNAGPRALTGLTLSVSLISFWMILKRLALLAFRTSQPWG